MEEMKIFEKCIKWNVEKRGWGQNNKGVFKLTGKHWYYHSLLSFIVKDNSEETEWNVSHKLKVNCDLEISLG